jgi:LAGLIDADG DNA endonuclease family protein
VYPVLLAILIVSENVQVETISRKGFDLMQFNPNMIPIEIGHYIAGFTDGEGSFNFSFRRRNDYKSGWKISACFNVSNKDMAILQIFKKYLECGTLRSRPDNVWYYEVNDLEHLVNNIVPFFKRFPFLSDKKRNDFSKFCEILEIILCEKPVSNENIRLIMDLRNQMNYGGKRKFSDKEILATLR